MGLLSLACWNCGIESLQGQGYLSLVKCCVLLAIGLYDGPIPVHSSPTEWEGYNNEILYIK
jgi:hypothetical protein